MPTNEKLLREATSEKPTSERLTNADAAAKLIRRMTAAKNMQLQIRKHGTTLHHQEQAKWLSDDDA